MSAFGRIASSIYNKFLSPFVDETIRKRLASYPSEQLFFDAAKFVIYNQIPGDYLEFGVYQGDSFAKVFGQFHRVWEEYQYYERLAGHEVDHEFMASKRFIAFDSFQGLPDSYDKSTPMHFQKGTYAAPQHRFMSNIATKGVDTSKVVLVPGWFDSSLTPSVKQKHNLNCASLIFIDCDLYESTVPILGFITDLIQDGTVIIVDDYFRYKGHPERGIQRAIKEWLEKNPEVGIHELTRCLGNRIAFVCYLREADVKPSAMV